MIFHSDIDNSILFAAIKQGKIRLGGNKKLNIYGHLNCKSGKRMKKENRLFFTNEKEAIKSGYRPCGHCMRAAYLNWKNNNK